MEGSTLQGLSYISMASNNTYSILPRAIFSSVPCVSIWGGSMNDAECVSQQLIQPSENQLNQGERTNGGPPPPEQPPSSEDPADAWFNAAGILLSLKHAAAERSARIGAPLEVVQWTPPGSDPSITQQQISHLPLNEFSSPTDTAAFLSSAIGSQNDSECPQDFCSGEVFQEETFPAHGHSSSQLGSKPNKCRLCDKVYARPSTLRTHMRTHSGEKPYQCHICLKSFSQDANLTAHLRIHSGEKPFKCLVCDRRFAQSSSVTTHMRTHTGERPYRCKMCSRGFAEDSHTEHLRTHTGEKPYKCKICQLKFSQSGNLNRHMRVHEH